MKRFYSNRETMGSTPFGDFDPTAFGSASPQYMKLVRGTDACAMASDRI
jgi:hypothetical protein